jgi:hypothetical protein
MKTEDKQDRPQMRDVAAKLKLMLIEDKEKKLGNEKTHMP